MWGGSTPFAAIAEVAFPKPPKYIRALFKSPTSVQFVPSQTSAVATTGFPPKAIPEVIKDVFGGGDKPKDGKDDGTYGGFTREDIESIQQKGFDQQNKIFQQGLAMQGIDKISQGILAGPKAYVEKVIPQIFAGNAAILSAGAADKRSLANIMAQPYRQLQRMNFYS